MRRLVRHGPSTLIVSLPANWVKAHGLKEKDEVEITERENQLLVSLKGTNKKEAITIDISNYDRTSTLLLMHAVYRSGLTKITFNFNKQDTIHFRTNKKISYSKLIHNLLNRFIGFEITKEGENYIEITQVSNIDPGEIETMVNRTFILLKDIIDSFCNGIEENNFLELQKIEDKHDSITKLITYLLRAMIQSGYDSKESTSGLVHIMANIDKIIDILKYLAREKIETNKNTSKEIYPLLYLITASFNDYNKLFHKYDIALIVSISKNRDEYKHISHTIKSSLNEDDLRTVTSLTQTLELLFDLVEWKMYLQIRKSLSTTAVSSNLVSNFSSHIKKV